MKHKHELIVLHVTNIKAFIFMMRPICLQDYNNIAFKFK
jgi:hypothetical protein